MGVRRLIVMGFVGLIMIGVLMGVLFGVILFASHAVHFLKGPGECYTDSTPASEPCTEIISREWIDDSTLVIKAEVVSFCTGGYVQNVGHTVDGNRLILKYRLAKRDPGTNEKCTHRRTDVIPNLKKGAYFISLVQVYDFG